MIAAIFVLDGGGWLSSASLPPELGLHKLGVHVPPAGDSDPWFYLRSILPFSHFLRPIVERQLIFPSSARTVEQTQAVQI